MTLMVVQVVPGAANEAILSWRTLGEDTACGRKAANGNSLLEGRPTNGTSLMDCQVECEREFGSACTGVEHDLDSETCRLFNTPFRHTHLAEGLECAVLSRGVPVEVYVMLPLDTLSSDGRHVKDPIGLNAMFDKMEEAKIDGFMVDMWWGLTEQHPRNYTFEGYRELFNMARARTWKVQVVASFHRCGGNIGDDCYIPLPAFVQDSGFWYTDAEGVQNHEYLSLFADDAIVVGGDRTPMNMYRDWMEAFSNAFGADLGPLITELMVGMGPCGELRYPSYPLDRWEFCGIGQFQAFDELAIIDLEREAYLVGHPEWSSPPSTAVAGDYNSFPSDTEFFSSGYQTEYGKFFLNWYSGALKRHGQRLLAQANAVMAGRVRVTAKVAGLHWWYNTDSHAAEATAGYYNTNSRNAYLELAKVFAEEGASMDFTCLEMRSIEQRSECSSNPEALVHQSIDAAAQAGITWGGENALENYGKPAFKQVLSYKPHLDQFTFLRLGPRLLQPAPFEKFTDMVDHFHQSEEQAQPLSATPFLRR